MNNGRMSAAVVGAGFIGPVHVEGLLRAGIPVTGVLGVDEAETRRVNERLGLPRLYRSFDQVLEDPEVSSVHLAVPNRLHFEMAKAVLRADKHVMCEKPLAMNSEESAELVRLAAESNTAAGVNYNIRYYPLCQEASDRVRSGSIGQVFHICGSYVQDWLLFDTDYNWRVLAQEGGDLRAVSDIGTHWLDLIHFITGMEIEAVFADLQTAHPVRKRPLGEVETFSGKETAVGATESIRIATEDFGSILIRFQGGARGCLWVSQVTSGRKNCLRFEIAASQQALAWCSESPNQLWVGNRQEPNQILLRDPALLSETARDFVSYPGGHNEGFPDTFKHCFRAFYRSIASGDFKNSNSYPTFEDGHREIVLCEAILKSARTGQWVEIF
jgi:predicted dehydrogenase